MEERRKHSCEAALILWAELYLHRTFLSTMETMEHQSLSPCSILPGIYHRGPKTEIWLWQLKTRHLKYSASLFFWNIGAGKFLPPFLLWRTQLHGAQLYSSLISYHDAPLKAGLFMAWKANKLQFHDQLQHLSTQLLVPNWAFFTVQKQTVKERNPLINSATSEPQRRNKNSLW